jgi:hypothetical protein
VSGCDGSRTGPRHDSLGLGSLLTGVLASPPDPTCQTEDDELQKVVKVVSSKVYRDGRCGDEGLSCGNLWYLKQLWNNSK